MKSSFPSLFSLLVCLPLFVVSGDFKCSRAALKGVCSIDQYTEAADHMPATGYARKANETSAKDAAVVTYTCDEPCDNKERMPVRHCCRYVARDVQFAGCEGPIPIVNGAS